jgi:osmoprotectant transport system permease protein
MNCGLRIADCGFGKRLRSRASAFLQSEIRNPKSAIAGTALPWRVLLLFALLLPGCHRNTVRVGSKLDTESVTLGEMATQLGRSSGASVEFRKQLGGTRIVWGALVAGEIDVYPEYTGTIAREILADEGLRSDEDIRRALASRGIEMTRPLGFNNTYAIGMREDVASRLGIRTISDLRSHPDVRLSFSNEFLNRTDGWPALRDRYGLPQRQVGAMEHALAYPALRDGAIDATDLYSTDAEIGKFGLRVLADDLHHFPTYDAVFLYRADLARRVPRVVEALRRLEGRVTEAEMVRLNARTKIDQTPNDRVAADFLKEKLGLTAEVATSSVAREILARTIEHLRLVSVSLLAAVLVGLPLGVVAAKAPRAGRVVLWVVAIIYTIPALALLVFLIPVLGIGAKPAILALFLYSLLPIVRNTHAGLTGIPTPLRESAEALGLPAWARLRRIELPLAAGPILAGIKTSAVIVVGTATLGGLIDAGGYGQPIFAGITLYNKGLILQGAIPAAVMALAAQGLFGLVERRLIPAGLREQRASI